MDRHTLQIVGVFHVLNKKEKKKSMYLYVATLFTQVISAISVLDQRLFWHSHAYF